MKWGFDVTDTTRYPPSGTTSRQLLFYTASCCTLWVWPRAPKVLGLHTMPRAGSLALLQIFLLWTAAWIVNGTPHIILTREILHFVDLVNRVGSDQSGLLTSKVLPLVWHLLGEIESKPTSSVGQLRQPTAELIECLSAQLGDIRALNHERLPHQTYQLLDELMNNLQLR